MKTTLMFGGAIGALMLSLAAPSFAAPTPPPPPAAPSASQPGPDGHRFGPHRGGRMGRMGGPDGGRFQRATPEERAKHRAERFAKIDTNKDGRVTEPEFKAFIEARKREREHNAFLRFSGNQEAVTLDQLNARAVTREREMQQRFQDRRGGRDGRGDRGGRGGPPQNGPGMGGFDGRDFDRPAPPPPAPAR